MYDLLKRLYSMSPRFVQEAYSSLPAGLRLGTNYRREFSLVQESQWWTVEQLTRLQGGRLASVLQHALSTVPFYQALQPYRGGDAVEQPYQLLRSLPFISKSDIRDRQDEFLSSTWSRMRAFYTTTGGTSGHPFGFWLDNTAYAREWAYINTVWGWFGYRFADRKATLRGVPFKTNKNQISGYNPLYNELLLSPFDMSEANLYEYVHLMRDFKPKFIHGYPSALMVLAKFVLRTGAVLPPLKAVFGVSENVYPGQQESMEAAFGCRFHTFYGMSERTVFASHCEHSSQYHIFPQFGVVELIDRAGRVIDRPGVRGEIVTTGFLNSVLPLIRYRTGDFAEWAEGECACGRQLPRLRVIHGRAHEVLVGRNNERISLSAINFHSRAFDSVERFQYVQVEPGKVQLLLVSGKQLTNADLKTIEVEFIQKVGDHLELELVLVPDIALTASGKAVQLKQQIPDFDPYGDS